MEAGQPVVSRHLRDPVPAGFPVLVPGQLFSEEILAFMGSLDTPEIHGYDRQAATASTPARPCRSPGKKRLRLRPGRRRR